MCVYRCVCICVYIHIHTCMDILKSSRITEVPRVNKYGISSPVQDPIHVETSCKKVWFSCLVSCLLNFIIKIYVLFITVVFSLRIPFSVVVLERTNKNTPVLGKLSPYTHFGPLYFTPRFLAECIVTVNGFDLQFSFWNLLTNRLEVLCFRVSPLRVPR